MNKQEFANYFEKRDKNKDYTDRIEAEFYSWEHEVDFLQEFLDVFWEYWESYLIVDEWIWFITDTECIYINKEYLEFCIEVWLKGEEAMTLYRNNLNVNTGIENCDNFEDYEHTYKKIIEWKTNT